MNLGKGGVVKNLHRLLFSFVVVAAACGSPEPQKVDSVPAATAPGSVVPNVEMIDVASGETVRLSDFESGERPLLLWMWAPH